MKRTRRELLCAATAATAGLAGCGGNGDSGNGDADATVTVGPDGAFEFDPEEVQVSTDDTVEWVWDSDGHNVVVRDQPDGAQWDGVPDLEDADYTHTHTFETAGEYQYVCEPHEAAGMVGTVVVE